MDNLIKSILSGLGSASIVPKFYKAVPMTSAGSYATVTLDADYDVVIVNTVLKEQFDDSGATYASKSKWYDYQYYSNLCQFYIYYNVKANSIFKDKCVAGSNAGVTVLAFNLENATATPNKGIDFTKLECVTLSSNGTIDVSDCAYIIISMAGWGTDNGTYGEYTTIVKYGNTTWNKKISHGNACDRSTCGGQNKLIIDNREKQYSSITVTSNRSGADIWGNTFVLGLKQIQDNK